MTNTTKKMTKKDFFELMDKAVICVSSLEDVVGELECNYWRLAHYYEDEEGDNEFAELMRKRARCLHNELTERGYYDK